jgi:glycosyltransferase involved in cell wall biosynthesis
MHDSRLFGVLVTYRRPDDLRRYLGLLAEWAVPLAGVAVVDNDPGPDGAALVAAADPSLSVEYVPCPENLGPAGGIRAGLEHVLDRAGFDRAGPGDWVVLLDDDNPPGEPGALAAVHAFADAQRAADDRVGMVGVGGGRFDRRRGRIQRLRDAELTGPVDVDFVPGNLLPVVSVAAVRRAGPPSEALFFGMEELEFGLRIRQAGFRIVLDGETMLERRRREGRTGDDVAPPLRKSAMWRRYYAVRNQIWIARHYGTRTAGLRATAENVLGRVGADLVRGRRGRLRLAGLGLRGAVDAWTGRLGRRVDPADPRYRADVAPAPGA